MCRAAGTSAAVVCEFAQDADVQADEVLHVPCLARLRPVDLLRLFRQGYEAVSLHPCPQGQCKYGSAWENIQSVADYVRGILARARPEARIELCCPESAAPPTGGCAGEAT